MMYSTRVHLFTLVLGMLMMQSIVAARNVKLTFYWRAEESRHSGPKNTVISTCDGRAIAKVSRSFAVEARMEGTGRLYSGKTVNLKCSCGGGFNCFSDSLGSAPYGFGSKANALVPFVSLSANDIPYGSTVMIQQLKGLQLPDGREHNGCVRVDDVSWSFGGGQVDLHVGDKKNYEYLMSKKGSSLNSADISVTKCTPFN